MRVAEQFDEVAQRYLSWSPSSQFQEIMRQTVLSSITSRTRTILEVGCGHGTWLKFILDNVHDSSILDLDGIDVSTARIAIARGQLTSFENVHVWVEDIETLAPSKTYDLIFFAEVLQFIPDIKYRSILRVCRDLLADGGMLGIVDKERYSLHALTVSIRSRLGQKPPEFRYIHYPSFSSLKRLASETGFAVREFDKLKEFRGLRLCKV
jgi:SAM-dependent methyltransferase